MEFLGVGYQELLVVMVLLLVVVGPERLPAVAYQVGKAVRTMQRYARAVRDEFSDEIEYLEDQYRTVRGEVDTARTELRDTQVRLNQELRESTAVALPPLIEPVSNVIPFQGAPPAALPAPGDSESAAPDGTPAPPLVF